MIRREFLKLCSLALLPFGRFCKRKRTALDLFDGDLQRWRNTLYDVSVDEMARYKSLYPYHNGSDWYYVAWLVDDKPHMPVADLRLVLPGNKHKTTCRFDAMEDHADMQSFELSVRNRVLALVQYCLNRHWGVGPVTFYGKTWDAQTR